MVTCQDDGCTIGEKPASYNLYTSSLSVNKTLFLNLNYSAPCNATMNAWSFCYLVQNSAETSTDTSDTTDTSVGIWRPNHGTYTLVDGTLTTLPRRDLYNLFDFICQRIYVPPFVSMEGDVVGVVVLSVPTVFSVIGGADVDSELWMSPLSDSGGYSVVNESDLEILLGYGLYITGLSGM